MANLFLEDLVAGEVQRAVAMLQEEISEATKQRVRNKYQNDRATYLLSLHHGWGTGVRNLLRQKGFRWDAITLDSVWAELVIMALGLKSSV